MIDWNSETARAPLFRLITIGSLLLGLYSLRFLLVGWTAPIGGHAIFFSSPVVAADLASVPWPAQTLRLVVAIGDFALPVVILYRPRWALYLAPILLGAAQAGWVEATLSGGNYAVHATMTEVGGLDWAEMLDWAKLALRLFVVAATLYFVLTRSSAHL